ncbi:SRY-box containing transcription factor 32, partial [Trametes versicolor FP-101664 SS1]|uniref:SRY-box containing transcription factor 32 n=1 Tax=Trametes versicolor (strain FP-101664) TaxID=717944 RepID=UPI0004623319
VKRPPNAFILFRSAQKQQLGALQPDHRMISKICGKVWGTLSEEDKAVWMRRAEEEKREHAARHPDYVFRP